MTEESSKDFHQKYPKKITVPKKWLPHYHYLQTERVLAFGGLNRKLFVGKSLGLSLTLRVVFSSSLYLYSSMLAHFFRNSSTLSLKLIIVYAFCFFQPMSRRRLTGVSLA